MFIDSTNRLLCQKNKLHIKNAQAVLSGLKLTGKIDFEQTNFAHKPKPTHLLSFYSSELKRRVAFEAVWYKNKIDITRFIDSEVALCP